MVSAIESFHCTLCAEKLLHGWWHVNNSVSNSGDDLSPGVLPIFLHMQLRDKIWEWLWDESHGYSSLRVYLTGDYYTIKDIPCHAFVV